MSKNIKIIDIRKMEQSVASQGAATSKLPELDNFLDNQDGGEESSVVTSPLTSEEGSGSDSGSEGELGHDEEKEAVTATTGGGRKKLMSRRSRSSSRASSRSGDSSASSTSTTRMLSSDPLFLVLYQYLVNNKGENIVTVLDKINKNLTKLVKTLSVDE